MSLFTLLEAAKYLDYRAEAQARGEEPQDYNTYALHLANGEMSPNANEQFLSQPGSPCNFVEEVKEKRQSCGKHVRSEDESGASLHDTESGDSGLRLGTREVHNRLEKNRRAHLKECFETLKKQIPSMDDKKTSNLSILRSALRYIQALKRKQRDYEREMERLAREKILQQQRLAALKKELSIPVDDLDIPEQDIDVETISTSTASETGPLSDLDDETLDATEPTTLTTVNTSVAVVSLPLKTNATTATVTVIPRQSPLTTVVTSSDVKSLTTLAVKTQHIPVTNPLPLPPPVHSTEPMTSSLGQASIQVPPTAAIQTITVSKTTGAIAVNSLVNSLAPQTTHLQIPAQMMSHAGIHMNGGASVISHPATVQVIAPQAVRVISANPTQLPVSAPTFAATVNVMTPRMAVTHTQKTMSNSVMTIAKTNLLPVTVATVMPQPNMAGKGLVATVTTSNAIPVTMAQLAVKASGIPTLSIPTTLTTLSRAVTLHTSSTAASQGIMSLTGMSGALQASSAALSTIQMTNSAGGVKPTTAHLLQPQICSPRAVIPHATVHTQGPHGTVMSAHLNNVARQMLTMKPVNPGAQVRPPIVTHVMQSTPGGQLVPTTNNHISTVTPLIAPVSVMNHAAAVAQVIAAQPQLGKMTMAAASPQLLKSVGQIPLVQAQQFLSPPQSLVKPVVVVSTPSVAAATPVIGTAQPVPHTT